VDQRAQPGGPHPERIDPNCLNGLDTFRCSAAGSPAIDVRLFNKDSDALQQLKIGLVDAYGTTLESAAYIMKQQPGTFATVGDPFGLIKCGLATRKDDTALHDALASALQSVQSSGTYDGILKTWNLSGDALKAS
jgi:polar amino acid transport system substrate-binding protein